MYNSNRKFSRGYSSSSSSRSSSHRGSSSRPSNTDRYKRFGSQSSRPSRKQVSNNISREKYIFKTSGEIKEVSIYDESKKFVDFGLSTDLLKNLIDRNYITPTKIQVKAIPFVLEGKDILGMASTGSGKTAAFLLPLIHNSILDRNQRCLIIVPTRELAMQIEDEFKLFAKGLNLHSVVVIGGTSISNQIRLLRRNPQYIIGTPGRLKDLEERRALNLSSFNKIVLDEVDRMLDMGFVRDIKLLISKLAAQRQTLFFSATMTSEVESIAKSMLKNPEYVHVEKQSAHKNVDQDIVKVSADQDKVDVLGKILSEDECKKVLIFSRTKHGADKLARKLYQKGFKSDSIHGDKRQNQRSKVIENFKKDHITVLVATDVAARGLDIPDITHVINFDEPATYEDYIHRIGRTGRIGKKGKALTFVS